MPHYPRHLQDEDPRDPNNNLLGTKTTKTYANGDVVMTEIKSPESNVQAETIAIDKEREKVRADVKKQLNAKKKEQQSAFENSNQDSLGGASIAGTDQGAEGIEWDDPRHPDHQAYLATLDGYSPDQTFFTSPSIAGTDQNVVSTFPDGTTSSDTQDGRTFEKSLTLSQDDPYFASYATDADYNEILNEDGSSTFTYNKGDNAVQPQVVSEFFDTAQTPTLGEAAVASGKGTLRGIPEAPGALIDAAGNLLGADTNVQGYIRDKVDALVGEGTDDASLKRYEDEGRTFGASIVPLKIPKGVKMKKEVFGNGLQGGQGKNLTVTPKSNPLDAGLPSPATARANAAAAQMDTLNQGFKNVTPKAGVNFNPKANAKTKTKTQTLTRGESIEKVIKQNMNTSTRGVALINNGTVTENDLNLDFSEDGLQNSINNLLQDKHTKDLLKKVIEKKKDAEKFLVQKEDLEREGMIHSDFIKDLTKIALTALFTGSSSALRAYGRDEERKKAQADKMAQIEQKEMNAKSAAQTKAFATLNKAAKTRSDKFRTETRGQIASLLSQGGAKGPLKYLSASSENLLGELQGKIDWGNPKMRGAILKAHQDAIFDGNKGFFADDNERASKANISGKFYQNVGVMVNGEILSRDSNSIKGSEKEDVGLFMRKMFKQDNPNEWSNNLHEEFLKEKKAGNLTDTWKNNFPGWVNMIMIK